jgi:DNA recombination protein RmuC
MELMEFVGMGLIALVLGFIVGGGLVWGLLQRRISAAAVAVTQSHAQVELLNQQLATAQAQQAERVQLEAMLNPVRDSLHQLSERSDHAHQERIRAESAIVQQLHGVREQYASLGGTTAQIAAALTRGQTRGQWGEMQLEQLLSHAGLIEGTHFLTQDDRVGELGKQRPDVIITMPSGGEVYVDAKFPFDAYWQAVGTDDPHIRETALAKHAKDVLARASELSAKGYSKGGKAADFVVMFLPFESLLSAALEHDGLILEKTFDKRVVLATPTTMLALLRTISFGYDRAAMATNAEEIQRQGMEMLNRLGTLVGHLDGMRKGIIQSVDGFNRFIGSFESQALSQARRMHELGVQAPKSLEAPEPISTHVRELRQSEAS